MGRYVNYIVVAKLADPDAHDEHDSDPRLQGIGREGRGVPAGGAVRVGRHDDLRDL